MGRNQYIGMGLALGTGMGLALGTAFHNIAIGMALGAGLGVAFGTALGAGKKPRDGDKDGPAS